MANRTPKELDRLAKRLHKNLEIKDRRERLKLRVHRKCFVGRAAVNYVIQTQEVPDVESALELLNTLLGAGVFHHVSRSHQVKNDNHWYRFAVDEPDFVPRGPYEYLYQDRGMLTAPDSIFKGSSTPTNQKKTRNVDGNKTANIDGKGVGDAAGGGGGGGGNAPQNVGLQRHRKTPTNDVLQQALTDAFRAGAMGVSDMTLDVKDMLRSGSVCAEMEQANHDARQNPRTASLLQLEAITESSAMNETDDEDGRDRGGGGTHAGVNLPSGSYTHPPPAPCTQTNTGAVIAPRDAHHDARHPQVAPMHSHAPTPTPTPPVSEASTRCSSYTPAGAPDISHAATTLVPAPPSPPITTSGATTTAAAPTNNTHTNTNTASAAMAAAAAAHASSPAILRVSCRTKAQCDKWRSKARELMLAKRVSWGGGKVPIDVMGGVDDEVVGVLDNRKSFSVSLSSLRKYLRQRNRNLRLETTGGSQILVRVEYAPDGWRCVYAKHSTEVQVGCALVALALAHITTPSICIPLLLITAWILLAARVHEWPLNLKFYRYIPEDQVSRPEFSSYPVVELPPDKKTRAKDVDDESTDIMGDMPAGFLVMAKGRMQKAQQLWRQTCEWRRQFGADTILERPHPKFFVIKETYPHYYVGVDRTGIPIYYERLGKANFPLLREKGVTNDDIVYHTVHKMEFTRHFVTKDPSGRYVIVMDVGGMNTGEFLKHGCGIVTKVLQLLQVHYPDGAEALMFANCASLFAYAFKAIKPILAETEQRKIRMLTSKEEVLKALQQYAELDQIPEEYGGTLKGAYEDQPMEVKWRGIVESANAGRPILRLNADCSASNGATTPTSTGACTTSKGPEAQ